MKYLIVGEAIDKSYFAVFVPIGIIGNILSFFGKTTKGIKHTERQAAASAARSHWNAV